MKICISLISILVLSHSNAWSEAAAIKNEKANYGIHFDASSGNYFSNSEPSFVIRPTGAAKYVDRIEVSINDSPFEVYKGQLKFKTEGLHTIKFRAVDPVHNWSPVQTFRVFVDMKPSASSYTWHGPHYKTSDQTFVGPSAKLVVSAEDNLSGIKQILVKEEAEKAPTLFTGPIQFAKEGPHKIQLASVDNVGNQENWIPYGFYVDATAPTTQFKVQGTSTVIGQKTYVNFGSSVILESSDKGAGPQFIEYKINGGAVAKYSNPIVFSDPVSELKYRAIDWTGNEEAWKAVTIYQDTTPPLVHIDKVGHHVLAEGKIFAPPGFVFKARIDDNQSGLAKVFVSKDGQKFEEASADLSFKFDTPGNYQFQIKAADMVQNSSESAPFTVVIDNKPPTTKIKPRQNLVAKEGYFLSGIPNVIDISGEDDGVGLKSIEYSYDGKNFQPLKGSIDLATWTAERQTLHFRGTDVIGNQEPVQTVTIEILKSGPKVDLFVESQGMPGRPLMEFGEKGSKPNPSKVRQPAKVKDKKE